MEQFEIRNNIITDIESGMQLKAVPDKEIPDDIAWVGAWYDIPGTGKVRQNFIVLDTGKPTYRLVDKALVYWGKETWNISGLDALFMSPAFGSSLLIPHLSVALKR